LAEEVPISGGDQRARQRGQWRTTFQPDPDDVTYVEKRIIKLEGWRNGEIKLSRDLGVNDEANLAVEISQEIRKGKLRGDRKRSWRSDLKKGKGQKRKEKR